MNIQIIKKRLTLSNTEDERARKILKIYIVEQTDHPISDKPKSLPQAQHRLFGYDRTALDESSHSMPPSWWKFII